MNHEQNKQLLETLNNCAAACNACIDACLHEKDVTMMATCIQLDMDCAAICTLTASFVARGSVHAPHLFKECAEICNACAAECEKHMANGMERCKICAIACRACAAACI